VISLVAGSALGDQNKLIDAALAAGVKRFIPSEFGSNTQSPRLLELVPIFGAKKATVDYLKKTEDKLSWTSIITGAFFDWGLKVGFLGFDAKSKTATLIDEGKGRFSTTNLRQIGRALIKALQKADETKNQVVYVSSFEVTQAELLPIVEKVTGGEKFSIKNVTSKELLESGNEKLKKGDFSGIPNLIKAGAFGGEGLGDHEPVGLWNERLGLEKEDLEESVRAGLSGKLVGEE
jgi:nucleoside-diphosphate-sugar epimerase